MWSSPMNIPGLALSNSLSPSSIPATPSNRNSFSLASSPATPSNAGSDIKLDFIFRAAKLSPPTKSSEVRLNPIIAKVNEILDCANKEGWTKLSDKEQVQLAFLIWKNQHKLLLANLGNDEKRVAEAMLEVLNPRSDESKALEPFLRSGGDDQKDDDVDYFQQFLLDFPIWRTSDTAVSIFCQRDAFGQQVLPLIRFQTLISMVCFVVSAANAILYYMIMTTGTTRDEAIAQYGINVGRFMRNNLTDEQTFQVVFRKNGGYPDEILESLLAHSTNPGNPSRTKTNEFQLSLYFESGGVPLVYQNMKAHLEKLGPLLVCDFLMFPKYTDTTIKTFGGSWDSWKDSTASDIQQHAFLITGVDYTPSDGMGGLVFQVQDSLPGRPFVNIGLELIQSMKVTILGIKKNVYFPGTTNANCFDNVPLILTSGSPSPSSSQSRRAVPKDIVTGMYESTEIGRLSSSDYDDSAVGDIESAAGGDNRSQKGLNEWPLDIDPEKDTTKLVLYT